MTNIRKEPCGGWIIVLLMAMPFIIGYVDQVCQSFLSGCAVFVLFSFFSTMIFDLVIMDFDFSLPVCKFF